MVAKRIPPQPKTDGTRHVHAPDVDKLEGQQLTACTRTRGSHPRPLEAGVFFCVVAQGADPIRRHRGRGLTILTQDTQDTQGSAARTTLPLFSGSVRGLRVTDLHAAPQGSLPMKPTQQILLILAPATISYIKKIFIPTRPTLLYYNKIFQFCQ